MRGLQVMTCSICSVDLLPLRHSHSRSSLSRTRTRVIHVPRLLQVIWTSLTSSQILEVLHHNSSSSRINHLTHKTTTVILSPNSTSTSRKVSILVALITQAVHRQTSNSSQIRSKTLTKTMVWAASWTWWPSNHSNSSSKDLEVGLASHLWWGTTRAVVLQWFPSSLEPNNSQPWVITITRLHLLARILSIFEKLYHRWVS